jgi:hypothetical protein
MQEAFGLGRCRLLIEAFRERQMHYAIVEMQKPLYFQTDSDQLPSAQMIPPLPMTLT